jgi:hypothetical protein
LPDCLDGTRSSGTSVAEAGASWGRRLIELATDAALDEKHQRFAWKATPFGVRLDIARRRGGSVELAEYSSSSRA